jgi:hypothetical protein
MKWEAVSNRRLAGKQRSIGRPGHRQVCHQCSLHLLHAIGQHPTKTVPREQIHVRRGDH